MAYFQSGLTTAWRHKKNKILFSTLRLCQVFLSVCHRSPAASLGDSQTTHQMIYSPCDWQRMTNYLTNGLLDCWELTRLAGSSAVVFLFFFISRQCGSLNSQRLTRQSNWFNIFFFFCFICIERQRETFRVSLCTQVVRFPPRPSVFHLFFAFCLLCQSHCAAII